MSEPVMPVATILLVDDELGLLHSLERVFRPFPLEILTAHTAQEALQQFQHHSERIQVVISDYQMPGEDGLWLLTQVGKQWPTCRRVLLSGHLPGALAHNAEALQSLDAALSKPCPVPVLMGLLCQLIPALVPYAQDLGHVSTQQVLPDKISARYGFN